MPKRSEWEVEAEKTKCKSGEEKGAEAVRPEHLTIEENAAARPHPTD